MPTKEALPTAKWWSQHSSPSLPNTQAPRAYPRVHCLQPLWFPAEGWGRSLQYLPRQSPKEALRKALGLLSCHIKALRSCLLLLLLHLQCGLSHQTPQEETWTGTRASNSSVRVGTVLWILSSCSAGSRCQTHNKMQSESRNASQTKPDLNLVNMQFSHLSAPVYCGLKEVIASNVRMSAVCFPCLRASACESSLKGQTGKGAGLSFPPTSK